MCKILLAGGGTVDGNMLRKLVNTSSRTKLFFAVLVLAVSGCGGSDFQIAPVSGIVTLNGEPLAGAHVGFEPSASGDSKLAGPGSYATTDDQGSFRLESLDHRDGAVVGKHKVTIRTFRAKRGPDGGVVVLQKERLPKRYHSKSMLTMDVSVEGTDKANFELESN